MTSNSTVCFVLVVVVVAYYFPNNLKMIWVPWNENIVDESLLRFSQMTFKVSGGHMLLSSFKGVHVGDSIGLTTPTLLSRSHIRDPAIGDCIKEYMRDYRKSTKSLLEKKGWNSKRLSPRNKADDAEDAHKQRRRRTWSWYFPFESS